MGETIVITSGKGGVGKTTVAVNIGAALAAEGARVCVVDADMGLRNVDIALGTQDEIVYDFLDVYDGYCSVSDALVKIGGRGELYMMPAPQSRDTEHISTQLSEVCSRIADMFEYVIIDCPAGIEQGFKNAVAAAGSAIVVTQCFKAAVRDADRAVTSLENAGISDIGLIINCVDPELIAKGVMLNLDDVVDMLGVRLIGVIPYDVKLMANAANGELAFGMPECISSAAYANIIKRMRGESVPISDMFTPPKGFFQKLRQKHKMRKNMQVKGQNGE